MVACSFKLGAWFGKLQLSSLSLLLVEIFPQPSGSFLLFSLVRRVVECCGEGGSSFLLTPANPVQVRWGYGRLGGVGVGPGRHASLSLGITSGTENIGAGRSLLSLALWSSCTEAAERAAFSMEASGSWGVN